MVEKLLDLIVQIWEHILPWYIVTEMEEGCVLRFGKFHKTSQKGLHWKLPFVDKVYHQHIKTCTAHLPSQSLTTLDNQTVVIKVIVRYTITDVKSYTLEVWDAHDIITDTIQGVIGDVVSNNDWDTIRKGIEEVILTQSHDIVSNWGVNIEKITLSDLTIMKTFRLVHEGLKLLS
jgi:regulator of protease activity HflC (stomatin/prohibitin superfamily)